MPRAGVGGGWGNGELVFHDCRVSVGKVKRPQRWVLVMIAQQSKYLLPQHCALTNGQNSRFPVVCILPPTQNSFVKESRVVSVPQGSLLF